MSNICIFFKRFLPAHPLATRVDGMSASRIKSPISPLRSSEARQPWKPCLECIRRGRVAYIERRTPPMYSNPCRSKCVLGPGLLA